MTDYEAAAAVELVVGVIIRRHRWLERHEVRPAGAEARIAVEAARQGASRIGLSRPSVRFFTGGQNLGEYDRASGCLWLRSGQPAAELVDTVWHELAHRGQHVARISFGHGKRYSPEAFAAHDARVTRRLARAVARRSGKKGNPR
jgi:hypothetical protein